EDLRRGAARRARAGSQSPVARITSEALITAVTLLPSDRPSSRTASTVIDATRRTPLADSSTLAIASPELLLVTRVRLWLRALTCMTASTLSDRDAWCPPLSERPAARPLPSRDRCSPRSPPLGRGGGRPARR